MSTPRISPYQYTFWTTEHRAKRIKADEDEIKTLHAEDELAQDELKIHFEAPMESLYGFLCGLEAVKDDVKQTEIAINRYLQENIKQENINLYLQDGIDLYLQQKILFELGNYVRYCLAIKDNKDNMLIYRGFLRACIIKLESINRYSFALDAFYFELQHLSDSDRVPLNEIKAGKHGVLEGFLPDAFICPISGLPLTNHYFTTTSGFQVDPHAYMAYLKKYNKDPFTDRPVIEIDMQGFDMPYYFVRHFINELKDNAFRTCGLFLLMEYGTLPISLFAANVMELPDVISLITHSSWMNWTYPLHQPFSFHVLTLAASHLAISCSVILAACFLIYAGLCLYQNYQADQVAEKYENSGKAAGDRQKVYENNRKSEECFDRFLGKYQQEKQWKRVESKSHLEEKGEQKQPGLRPRCHSI